MTHANLVIKKGTTTHATVSTWATVFISVRSANSSFTSAVPTGDGIGLRDCSGCTNETVLSQLLETVNLLQTRHDE